MNERIFLKNKNDGAKIRVITNDDFDLRGLIVQSRVLAWPTCLTHAIRQLNKYQTNWHDQYSYARKNNTYLRLYYHNQRHETVMSRYTVPAAKGMKQRTFTVHIHSWLSWCLRDYNSWVPPMKSWRWGKREVWASLFSLLITWPGPS